MLSIYPFIESYPRERDNALTPGVDSPNSEADPCAVSEHLNIHHSLSPVKLELVTLAHDYTRPATGGEASLPSYINPAPARCGGHSAVTRQSLLRLSSQETTMEDPGSSTIRPSSDDGKTSPSHPPSPGESPRASSASDSSPEPRSAAEKTEDGSKRPSSESDSPAPRRTVRRRRSINRGRDPPTNDRGQHYCDHPDCAAKVPTFQRRCEWNKHMDKHERPYRCGEPGCEKLRGFTYSGGLMRHEREVHRKHGGLKKPLMCPHENCKRSSGVGFTRQENLNEHLRRVHQKVEKVDPGPGSDDHHPPPDRSPKKRKRSGDDNDPEADPHAEEAPDSPSTKSLLNDLQQEVKRLRTENAEMKADLREHREKLLRLLKGG